MLRPRRYLLFFLTLFCITSVIPISSAAAFQCPTSRTAILYFTQAYKGTAGNCTAIAHPATGQILLHGQVVKKNTATGPALTIPLSDTVCSNGFTFKGEQMHWVSSGHLAQLLTTTASRSVALTAFRQPHSGVYYAMGPDGGYQGQYCEYTGADNTQTLILAGGPSTVLHLVGPTGQPTTTVPPLLVTTTPGPVALQPPTCPPLSSISLQSEVLRGTVASTAGGVLREVEDLAGVGAETQCSVLTRTTALLAWEFGAQCEVDQINAAGVEMPLAPLYGCFNGLTCTGSALLRRLNVEFSYTGTNAYTIAQVAQRHHSPWKLTVFSLGGLPGQQQGQGQGANDIPCAVDSICGCTTVGVIDLSSTQGTHVACSGFDHSCPTDERYTKTLNVTDFTNALNTVFAGLPQTPTPELSPALGGWVCNYYNSTTTPLVSGNLQVSRIWLTVAPTADYGGTRAQIIRRLVDTPEAVQARCAGQNG